MGGMPRRAFDLTMSGTGLETRYDIYTKNISLWEIQLWLYKDPILKEI